MAPPGAPGPSGTPRRRALSLPRTPLSTAEAVEIVLGAVGGDEVARRARAAERAERAELAECELSRQRSAGDTAVNVSWAASLDAALGLLPGSAKAASTPGGSSKWRAFFRPLSPPRRLPGLPLWRRNSLELPPRAASLPDPKAAAAAAAAELLTAGAMPLPSPWGQLPEAPSPVATVDLGPPAAGITFQPAGSPIVAAVSVGGSAAGATPFGHAFAVPGGSSGGSSSASGQATPQRGRGSLEGGSPALHLRGIRGDSLEGSPPQRAQRRAVSQAPDLPTVISQQVLLADELPSLPPLHIPLHHQLTITEDPGSDTSAPSARHAQQTRGEPGSGSGSGGSTPRPGSTLPRRPSTSSTAFWLGTPKAPQGRRQRSRWLQERALGRSFMAGAAGSGEQG